MNNDKKATLAGCLLATLTALSIDYQKLAAFDRAELCKIGVGVLLGVLGYLTNK